MGDEEKAGKGVIEGRLKGLEVFGVPKFSMFVRPWTVTVASEEEDLTTSSRDTHVSTSTDSLPRFLINPQNP